MQGSVSVPDRLVAMSERQRVNQRHSPLRLTTEPSVSEAQSMSERQRVNRRHRALRLTTEPSVSEAQS
ncbi:hypothetical protein AW168_05835 [Nocardia brasiliensis]|nr:hypothetical protein AW168_05835 [Nocardia brasiliensis]